MKVNGAFLFAGIAAVLAACLPTGQAQAQDTPFKKYVAFGGTGTACTFTAPCGNFTAALDATTAGGEIVCLDSGNFPTAFTINKSITIDCTGTAATIFQFTVNAPGSTITVRGLTLFGSGGILQNGIEFLSGTALIIENSVIRSFGSAGIRFRPNGPAQLAVTNTLISDNGSGSTGGGIVVSPQAGGTAVVSLDRVTVANNVFGIAVDGTGSTGGIATVIRNSTVHRSSQMGIVATAPAGGAPMGVLVENTASVSNGIGIGSFGAGTTVRADNATVMHNGTGLSFGSGGALLSAGNNLVTANGTNGAFSGTVALQ